MARRRGNSRNFNIGAKSPYVLDLRAPEKSRRTRERPSRKRPSVKRATRSAADSAPEPLEKEKLLKELETIESYDTRLALSFNAPFTAKKADFSESSYNEELDSFLGAGKSATVGGNKQGKTLGVGLIPSLSGAYSPRGKSVNSKEAFGKIFNFALLSAFVALFVFGAFFVQKNIIGKETDIGKAKGADQFNKASRDVSALTKVAFALETLKSFDFGEGLALKDEIPYFLKSLSSAKDLYEAAPALLGYEGPRKYIIVFQNSSELRPTGGFVGSYAIADVREGSVKDVEIDGIYNLDGQLTVNVVPPYPFQHITTAWSAHDANWFLDFPLSADKIMWFFEKAGAGKADGLIALNVDVVEKLLALTGPISMPEYGLVLDAENFRDEVQYEVEVAYDKELNRPKKILDDFAPLFFEKLSGALQSSAGEVATAIAESLEKKDIMLYSKNKEIQKFFEGQGWSGSVKGGRCQLSAVKCQESDYLAVVHSNIGGYKTSKYMGDEVNYGLEVGEDGSLVAHLTIRRSHNGGDTKYWWYNRKNIDYVKIYVPEGAEILSYEGGVRRGAEPPADYGNLNFTKDPDISLIEEGMSTYGPVDIFKESGKTVFATWLVTNAKGTGQFKINYKLPFKINFKNEIAKYNLYLQKQPGTNIDVSFGIKYPSWVVLWDNAKSEFMLDKDKVVGYIFQKNLSQKNY